mgnify:CR=1 FL=1
MSEEIQNPLNDKWTLWYHLTSDNNWNVDSYKKIAEISTLEETTYLANELNELYITNCMFFIMKNNIFPVWEDQANKKGGCFSFKIQNRQVYEIWNSLIFLIVGNTLFDDENHMKLVNGITISPKKYFCIIKIWMASCEVDNVNLLNKNANISYETCMFKKHQE